MGEKFKFQVQDRDLEYSLGDFDKYTALSENNLPLVFDKKFSVDLIS